MSIEGSGRLVVESCGGEAHGAWWSPRTSNPLGRLSASRSEGSIPLRFRHLLRPLRCRRGVRSVTSSGREDASSSKGGGVSEGEFVFRGDITDTPIPEMLATIHRYGVPGVMEVVRDDGSRQVADSYVAGVGPTAQQLPMRLWHSPTVPEWGWPVKILLPAGLTVLCDEQVGGYGE